MLPKDGYYPLLTGLNHKSADRRRAALAELGASGDPRAPGPVARRLFDAEADLRHLAAAILADHGLGEAGQAVLDLYRDGTRGRARAVAGLAPLLDAEMPAPHVAAIAVTAAGLHELFDGVAAAGAVHSDKFVRRAAIEGLYQVNQPALAAAFLLPSTDEDPGVRRYAAVALAENAVLIGAGRLCRDPERVVADAARAAFARPGEPALVRDPHRRVMDRSSAFALPECGSSLLPHARFPRLAEAARSLLRSTSPGRVDVAVTTLLRLGRPREEVRALLDEGTAASTMRRVAAPPVESAPAAPLKRDPELDGRRILLVGGDGVEAPLLATLRATGLAVDWVGGFDNAAARLTRVRFEAVLILTKRVSHAVGDHALRIGEECGAVIVHVHTLGQASVLDAAREALG